MRFNKFFFAFCSLLLLFSCKKEEPAANLHQQVIDNYAQIVFANYEDALLKASALHQKLQIFVKNPSALSLLEAKEAWIAARYYYSQTEVFRMYAGPIDDDNGPEGRINGWPMDESYVDYVEGNLDAGIINQIGLFPNINKALIQDLNEKNGETNISTGFHAIEFLLWGQDFNQEPNAAGKRPYADYVVGTGKNAARRGQYLLATSELLIDDLVYLKTAWNPDENNFRKQFTSTPLISIRKIVQALRQLTEEEFAGERMQVAYDTQNQEDEHSCFSDQTHNDHRTSVIGLENVYLGKYKRIDGTMISGKSLSDLVILKNPTQDNEMKKQLTITQISIGEISIPFDQAILKTNLRIPISNSISHLREISKQFIKIYDTIKE